MRPADRRLLATGSESLNTVLTNGVQQREARLARGLLNLPNQAVVDQRSHAVQHIYVKILLGITNRLNALQSAPADKNGNPPKQFLLGRTEQVIAPIHRPSQRLLPHRQIFGTTSEKLQRTFQSRLHRRWRKQLDTRSG